MQGGKREGAGRPRSLNPATKGIRVSETAYAKILAHADAENMSLADAADHLISVGVNRIAERKKGEG